MKVLGEKNTNLLLRKNAPNFEIKKIPTKFLNSEKGLNVTRQSAGSGRSEFAQNNAPLTYMDSIRQRSKDRKPRIGRTWI